MSGLYQYFLTTVLLVAVALFTTLMFYPRAPPDPSVAVQNVIDGLAYDAVVTRSSLHTSTEPTTSAAVAAKYIIILTYQRCGSSFFGNVFNLNPDAFYAYEPLDSLYSALYGTVPAWNGPSDIANTQDGKLRKIPQVEINAVADFLRHLLTAEVDKLPTATIVHPFWTYFGNWHKETRNFTGCLKKQNLTRIKCYRMTSSYCGNRFGTRPPHRMEQCRRLLTNETQVTTSDLTPRTVQQFNDYHSCFQSYRERAKANCTEMLRKAIAGHRLRATKLVRATMASMRPLLRALPTLRIMHLVRDPRAVVLSRSRLDASMRGIYTERMFKKSGSRLVPEASLYCNHVTADIRSRLALEREFPGRIMWMRYEDVVDNPEQRFRDLYKLLDEPIPKATLKQMEKMAFRGQTKNLTTKWQKRMNLTDQIEIANRCSDFFRLIGVSPNGTSLTTTTATHKRRRH